MLVNVVQTKAFSVSSLRNCRRSYFLDIKRPQRLQNIGFYRNFHHWPSDYPLCSQSINFDQLSKPSVLILFKNMLIDFHSLCPTLIQPKPPRMLSSDFPLLNSFHFEFCNCLLELLNFLAKFRLAMFIVLFSIFTNCLSR